MSPDRRAAVYLDAARALGFGTRRGRIDVRMIAGEIRREFDDFQGFEHQGRLLATAAHPLAWLRPLFDQPERSLHPVCHLLLIEYLFGSVAAFKTACSADASTLKGAPQLPVMQAESETRPTDVRSISPRSSPSARELVLRDPSLSCRQVATQVGLSVTTVVTWRRAHGIPIRERRKRLHPSVIDKVLEALESVSSTAAVAAETGVSLSSVYRILAQHPMAIRRRLCKIDSEQTSLRRARWVSAV
ncbi:TnsD family Tn7-like transposition protein, partial [Nostoc sp. NIES-2111]